MCEAQRWQPSWPASSPWCVMWFQVPRPVIRILLFWLQLKKEITQLQCFKQEKELKYKCMICFKEKKQKQLQSFCVSSICIEKSTQWTHESCLSSRPPWKPHRSVTVPKCSDLTDLFPFGHTGRLWPNVVFFVCFFLNTLAATHVGCSRYLGGQGGQIFWFQGKYFAFHTVK